MGWASVCVHLRTRTHAQPSELQLPTLADAGYRAPATAFRPRQTPPTAGGSPSTTAPTTPSCAHCAASAKRGFALLTGRWYSLRHTTASPRSTGDIVRAGSSSPNPNTGTYRILAEITSLLCIQHVQMRAQALIHRRMWVDGRVVDMVMPSELAGLKFFTL